MESQKQTAIVLRAVKSGEHDKMLTLYTLGKGKMSAMAKGAQSMKSKYLGASQLFSVSEFVLSDSYKTPYVISGDVVKNFDALPKKIASYAAANYCAELISDVSEEGEADAKAFSLLYHTLCVLNRAEEEYARVIASAYALKLMGINGTYPCLDRCVSCGKTFSKYIFDFDSGGAVCSGCAENYGEMPMITADEAQYMNMLLYVDVEKLDKTEPRDENSQKYLLKQINNYIIYTISKKIKSFDTLYAL